VSSLATVGTIRELWRYPVKSMGGEPVTATALSDRGLAGDRRYLVIDQETGQVASAKAPRKWAGLLGCRAGYLDEPPANGASPPIEITFPGGGTTRSTDPDVHRLLSTHLGRSVRLETTAPNGVLRETDRSPIDALGTQVGPEPIALAAPPGTFFDVAPLHVITDQSLAALATRGPGRFAVGRFRPNVVVMLYHGAAPFAENDWLGRSMAIGASVIRIIDPSPRCVVTTLATGDLPRDPTILKAIVEANSATSITLAPGVRFPGVLGVYARVEAEGTVRVGDPLGLTPTPE
jgi:uncharacterized protein YcbX